MATFIFCIVAGVWDCYNFITYIRPSFGLPYFCIFKDMSPTIRVLNMMCLSWSPILGVLLIAFGVVGLLFRKKEGYHFESFKYFMFIFALITSIGMML